MQLAEHASHLFSWHLSGNRDRIPHRCRGHGQRDLDRGTRRPQSRASTDGDPGIGAGSDQHHQLARVDANNTDGLVLEASQTARAALEG